MSLNLCLLRVLTKVSSDNHELMVYARWNIFLGTTCMRINEYIVGAHAIIHAIIHLMMLTIIIWWMPTIYLAIGTKALTCSHKHSYHILYDHVCTIIYPAGHGFCCCEAISTTAKSKSYTNFETTDRMCCLCIRVYTSVYCVSLHHYIMSIQIEGESLEIIMWLIKILQ
jgi:hypothetical protein